MENNDKASRRHLYTEKGFEIVKETIMGKIPNPLKEARHLYKLKA